MKDKLKNIVLQTECPSTEAFYNYLDNNLSKNEIHVFETHLNDCEFCNEALAGFKQTDKQFVINTVANLNSKIDNRVKKKFSLQYLTVAATLLITLFFGSIYFLNDSIENEEVSIVANTSDEKLNEDKLAPREVVEEEIIENKPLVELEEVLEEVEENFVEQGTVKEINENTIVKDIVEQEELEEEIIIYEDDSSGDMDLSVEKNKMETEEEAYPMTETKAVAAASVSANKYDDQAINFDNLLAFATEKVNTQFFVESTQSIKKSKKNINSSENEAISYEYGNTNVLLELIDEVSSENTLTLLDKIKFEQMKDIWTSEEQSTLKWLEIISMLKLNLTPKEQLKELKKNKNPYQEEAKKLYYQLY